MISSFKHMFSTGTCVRCEQRWGEKKQVWAGDLTYLVEYLPNMQDPGSIPCLASARHGGAHQSSSTRGGDRRTRSSGSSLTLSNKFSNLDYTRPYLKQRLRPSKRVTGSKFIPSSLTVSLVPGPHVLQGECWLFLSPLTSHVYCRVSGTHTHRHAHNAH